jgi:hypothetical protein
VVLHVLSPRAFTASHLSLALHERLAVAAIALLRPQQGSQRNGGWALGHSRARTRDDHASTDQSVMTCAWYISMQSRSWKKASRYSRPNKEPNTNSKQAAPLSSSSSNQSIIGAYRVSITFRLLPNPTRHGPPSHASDPYCDVMNAS